MAQHGSLFGLSARRDALREESARLRGLPRVDSVASYWPAIHRLVLLGRVEAALELLTAHPAYQHLGDPSMAVKVWCVWVSARRAPPGQRGNSSRSSPSHAVSRPSPRLLCVWRRSRRWMRCTACCAWCRA
jgi:hypothetical protein